MVDRRWFRKLIFFDKFLLRLTILPSYQIILIFVATKERIRLDLQLKKKKEEERKPFPQKLNLLEHNF